MSKFNSVADTELGSRTIQIIDFEGHDDSAKPCNWSLPRKWSIVLVLAAMSFVAGLGSSIAAPAVSRALVDFNSDNEVLASLIISVYNVGLAIGPILVAPMSEMYGRLIPYHVTNVLFTLSTMGCALSPNLPALVVFRMLAGMQASSVLTIGGATVGDLFAQQNRGQAIAIWTFGPLMGPVIGPVAGGYVAEAGGWRWVFWMVVIMGAVCTVLFFLIVRETYAPVLLERKVACMRRKNNDLLIESALKDNCSRRDRLARASRRPLVLLFRSPIVFLLSIFVALVFSYQILLFVTIPTVFSTIYSFSVGSVGLAYIGIGVGLLIGNAIFGYTSDRMLTRKAHGRELKPEYRLPLLIPGAYAIPACFFIYGWTAYYRVHWIVPICATSLLGIGLNMSLMTIQVYLIDIYPLYSASALASLAILRSIMGAFLPLSGPPLYNALGLGWGNSTLAFVALVLIPVPFLFVRYGEAIRTNPRFQLRL